MAFYIDLDKIEHTNEYVRYKYYNTADNVGILELNFSTLKFKEIQPTPYDINGYMFERAAMKITKHWNKGELPDKTCWAS